MRQGGKTQAMIDFIKKQRGLILVPCYSATHARGLLKRFEQNGLKAQVTARVNKGMIKRPHKTRRSIQIEVFN